MCKILLEGRYILETKIIEYTRVNGGECSLSPPGGSGLLATSQEKEFSETQTGERMVLICMRLDP